MKEIIGNLWDFHRQGHWVVITTNGVVRRDGACVMGRGVARQAARKFPHLPYELGAKIKAHGNRVHVFSAYRLITFPVKHRWWEKADISLIAISSQQLQRLPFRKVYLVRPGCGNGQLDWDEVKPLLEQHLDDRFIVVHCGNEE